MDLITHNKNKGKRPAIKIAEDKGIWTQQQHKDKANFI
jgi:hypothetical protein